MESGSGEGGAGSTRGLTGGQQGAIGALAIAGGISSFVQSRTRNTILESQVRQTQRAVAFGEGQIDRSAGAQIRDRARESAQLKDRLRVTQAETGLSTASLETAEAIRLGENIAATNANASAQKAQLFISGAQNIQGLENQKTNPFLSGTSGLVSGLSAGLQIATLGGNINKGIDLDDRATKAENFLAGTSATDSSVSTQQFGVSGSAPSGEFNLLNTGRTFDR